MKKLLLILTIIALLTNCKLENFDDCFVSVGNKDSIVRECSAFDSLFIEGNVNIIFLPQFDNKVHIVGGKNLLGSIEVESKNTVLTVKNILKCNWVRSYKNKIDVYIGYPAGNFYINYKSTGNVYATDTLRGNEIYIDIWEGCGSVKFAQNITNATYNIHYGTVDVEVSGKSNALYVSSNSYGKIDCRNLLANYIEINNNSTNNCWVYTSNALIAQIHSLGNIYYKVASNDDDYNISLNKTGSGNLIKIE